jgi:transcriptional regulator with XRE-family HTH domain
MEQLMSAPPPRASFGTLLRACRQGDMLSQEQLAARAELSERTIRNLEASRVRSPRTDTVRLLADALPLSGPQRTSWFAAARAINYQRAELAAPGACGPAHPPGEAPARRQLGACGVGVGNRSTRRSSPATELTAETVALSQRDGRLASQAANDADPDETAAKARAGLVDEIRLHVVPILVGAGTRRFERRSPKASSPTRSTTSRRRSPRISRSASRRGPRAGAPETHQEWSPPAPPPSGKPRPAPARRVDRHGHGRDRTGAVGCIGSGDR